MTTSERADTIRSAIRRHLLLQNDTRITIVSGLPRSGTSMMMRMLEVGGIPIYTDSIRQADRDNPKGYYELEAVKTLARGESEFLGEARSKAIKVVSPLLRYLPRGERYRIILMQRKMEEILKSQRKMLSNRSEPTRNMDDAKLAQIYERDLRHVKQWMSTQAGIEAIFINYNGLLSKPMAELSRLDAFLDETLDLEAMAAVIEPTLYRNRR